MSRPQDELWCMTDDEVSIDGLCPNFTLSVTLNDRGSARYFVITGPPHLEREVSAEVYRDLVQLKIAGEAECLRQEFRWFVNPNDPDSAVESLKKIAKRLEG